VTSVAEFVAFVSFGCSVEATHATDTLCRSCNAVMLTSTSLRARIAVAAHMQCVDQCSVYCFLSLVSARIHNTSSGGAGKEKGAKERARQRERKKEKRQERKRVNNNERGQPDRVTGHRQRTTATEGTTE